MNNKTEQCRLHKVLIAKIKVKIPALLSNVLLFEKCVGFK